MKQIQYIDRESGQLCIEKIPGEKWLKWLYNKPFGRLSLHYLIKRKFISSYVGKYMDTRKSTCYISDFIRNHGIDLLEYKKEKLEDYKTFNDFFCRKIKPSARPIDDDFVSPADGKILAFKNIRNVKEFFVKGASFNLEEFLGSEELADKYKDGSMIIVRLAPKDYHRYHFPADGIIRKANDIKGHYYSVSPLALQKSLRIFCANCRSYSILETQKYGDVLYSEVGATFVGSIIQTYAPDSHVKKGAEKGYFAYGGSTLVLLFEKGKIQIDEDLLENTANGLETYVPMGRKIAS
ncbi:phosphatidylserine decarboxylase [Halosquirtibacter xylanolyticus]|uniref:phosphatidylserine decarboxylase n=1 Tax=Halosquirtibacter xylanolyticus TaxID=3374599 RepID=UPI003749552F|nr:phosphatidylserine decarboxylase [Prolixibacteraceae bacterium]